MRVVFAGFKCIVPTQLMFEGDFAIDASLGYENSKPNKK